MEQKNEQWFNNKDLFMMLQELRSDMQSMSLELKQTRDKISYYNGLREEVKVYCARVTAIEEQAKGRSSVGTAIRAWGGWVIAIISLVITLSKVI